jgi:hypothetical protein
MAQTRNGWTHYHVGNNMVGYMSESDIYLVKTRRDAERALADESRRWRSDGDADSYYVRTSGSASEGDIYLDRRGKYASEHSLEQHLWWMRCDDLNCYFNMTPQELRDYDIDDATVKRWHAEFKGEAAE